MWDLEICGLSHEYPQYLDFQRLPRHLHSHMKLWKWFLEVFTFIFTFKQPQTYRTAHIRTIWPHSQISLYLFKFSIGWKHYFQLWFWAAKGQKTKFRPVQVFRSWSSAEAGQTAVLGHRWRGAAARAAAGALTRADWSAASQVWILELPTKFCEVAVSLLKVPTRAFAINNILRHHAKQTFKQTTLECHFT